MPSPINELSEHITRLDGSGTEKGFTVTVSAYPMRFPDSTPDRPSPQRKWKSNVVDIVAFGWNIPRSMEG